MTLSDDREYYASRAAAERAMAERTDDPQIARVHHDFARHYEAAMARPVQAGRDRRAL